MSETTAATVYILDGLISTAETPTSRRGEQRMSRSAWRQAGFVVRPGERGQPETQYFNGFQRTVLTYSRSQVESTGIVNCPSEEIGY